MAKTNIRPILTLPLKKDESNYKESNKSKVINKEIFLGFLPMIDKLCLGK